jgi:hypothetical protein
LESDRLTWGNRCRWDWPAWTGDAFHDVVMMALLRKEWPPAQKLDQPAASVAAQKALS